MKFSKKHKTEILEGDLTPMIDMTFQLIAFFMLLINFSEVDRAEEITLPSSVLAVPPEVRPDYQIILNIEPEGFVKFEGRAVAQIKMQKPENERSPLEAIFVSQIDSAGREGVKPGDIAVVIRSHEDTPTGLVQGLISECQNAELESFSLRVKEKVN